MRDRKVSWLVLFVALGLWACGSNETTPDVEEDLPACGNGVLEDGEVCDDGNTAAGDGCSASCAVEEGWECDENSVCTQIAICEDGECVAIEICDNGIDDDENGLIDCNDPFCETAVNCRKDCAFQDTCLVDLPSRATAVCSNGACKGASTFDEEGNVVFGEVGIVHQYDTLRTKVSTLGSYSVVILHPDVPGSAEKLDCDTLMKMVRNGSFDPGGLNVIKAIGQAFAQTGDRQNDLIRLADVQVTSDEDFLVVSRFYTGGVTPTGVPTGQMPAFSCLEGFKNPPGEWHASRQVSVKVEPSCRENSHCPENWTCHQAVGLCSYEACDPACDSGAICRELPNGDPFCLISCEGGTPCAAGYRCDQSPGWRPACFED